MLTLLLVFLLCLLIWALPNDMLPAPSGKAAIGTCIYRFAEGRKDPFSAHGGKDREIAVQVWYPAQKVSDDSASAPYMARFSDLNPFLRVPLFALLANHLPLVKTHSYLNAPLSNLSRLYPVLFFSHGLMGGRFQNTAQIEELASHGFIVVAPDHTYEAAFAVFPDGHVITSQLLAGRESADAKAITNVDLDQRIKDMKFLIAQFERLNMADDKGLFTNRLDMNHIGVFGHSMGGRTAIYLAQHAQIQAAIAYDGGPSENVAPNCPLMIIEAARAGDPLEIDRLKRTAGGVNSGPIYDVKLAGAGHANFTDLPFITRLHWILGLSGGIDQFEAAKIINAYTLAFFSKYLRSDDIDILKLKFDQINVREIAKSSGSADKGQ